MKDDWSYSHQSIRILKQANKHQASINAFDAGSHLTNLPRMG
jgi:hypothetical protein